MLDASGGLADRGYFRTLADNAVQTIGWLQTRGVEFITPIYYPSAGPARIQPIGGGRAIVERLSDGGTAPNAVAVLRALVFGQIAGREAVSFLQSR
jgi:hypothetical protein